MKHTFYVLIFFIFLAGNSVGQKLEKNRLLITTDIGGDPDDQQSLVRLMVYLNEFEIEGLISSAAGTPGELKEEKICPELIEEIIQGYKMVYKNLLNHDNSYPNPEYLLSVMKRGNYRRGWNFVGEGHDTEGSEWIISRVDKKDSRPLNICIFGGQTDLAQALWKIKNTRTAKDYQKFVSKIRVYDIDDQDRIFNYIQEMNPTIFYVLAKSPVGEDKLEGAYRGMYLGGDESLTSLEWLQQHVVQNHGPLGRLYPLETWTQPNPNSAMKEGDTPSWFFFLNNGLNVPEQPILGGWGGRFILNNKEYYSDAKDSFLNEKSARATVYRWRVDFQNDWAARMDWCVKDFDSCNHNPIVIVNRSVGTSLLKITARPGKKVILDATRSYDPDGQSLLYEWEVYPNGRYSAEILTTEDNGIARIHVPELNSDENISIVLKVRDNGTPQLVSYKRILIVNH